MYSNKFVVSVRSNGKVLLDQDGIVKLPFGSEYSITLKNLNTAKCVVKVKIDGTVVTSNGLILDADSTTTLKGKLDGTSVNNKFKFIKLTKQIEKYKGRNSESSLINVSFQFERDPEITVGGWYVGDCFGSPSTRHYVDPSYQWNTLSTTATNYIDPRSVKLSSCDASRDGITVKGSPTAQQFSYGNVDTLESKTHSIILKLIGETRNKVIHAPVITKAKITCGTCGKRNKNTFNYCVRCGTYIQ